MPTRYQCFNQLLIRVLEWLQAPLCSPPRCQGSRGWYSSSFPPGNQGQLLSPVTKLTSAHVILPIKLTTIREAPVTHLGSVLMSLGCEIFRPVFICEGWRWEQWQHVRGSSTRDVTREKIEASEAKGELFKPSAPPPCAPRATIHDVFPAQRSHGQRHMTSTG